MKLNIKKLVAIIFVAFVYIRSAEARNTLIVNNNFEQPLVVTVLDGSSRKTPVASYASSSFNVYGFSIIVDVPGYGSIFIKDLGMNHIDGDDSKTWGILFSYLDSDMVARYNGGDGPINLGVGSYGEVSLSGSQVNFKNVVISRLVNN